jgi:hypothetical protein
MDYITARLEFIAWIFIGSSDYQLNALKLWHWDVGRKQKFVLGKDRDVPENRPPPNFHHWLRF